MEHLQRITLSRHGQIITMQGMVHVGPQHFYEKVQQLVTDHYEAGKLIFREGINPGRKYSATIDVLGEKERDIGKTLLAAMDGHVQDAAQHGCVLEADQVKYFGVALVADMPIDEVSVRLAQVGFNGRSWFAHLIRLRAEQKYKLKTKKQRFSLPPYIMKPLALIFYAVMYFPAIRPFIKVIIHDRNLHAMEIVLGKLAETKKDALVVFGDDHLKGMVNILKQHGWKVVTRETIEA